jgi:anti-sigma-K factor RskA/putative zinc finger protein
MLPDATPELGHPDAAAWALGALDPEEAERFPAHLQSCGGCRIAVAEFEQVARALAHPPPAVEPPPDLQARTLASVRWAVVSAKRAQENPAPAPALAPALAPAKMHRWWRWHWNLPVFSVAAALGAAAAAIVIALVQVVQTVPAQAQTVIPLRAASGSAASGQATAVHTDGGWSIRLTVSHLPPLGPGQFYECWYAGPGNRAGHPELITAGTFILGRSGAGSFTMWSAANPQVFKTMQITAERPGNAGQHGQVILTGTARS